MKSGKSRATILGFPFFFVPASFRYAPPAAQHALHSIPSIPQELLERPVTLRTGIGTVHDDAATKNAEAQRFYDQGLAYLHNYVWIEAARSFHQALRLDREPRARARRPELRLHRAESDRRKPDRRSRPRRRCPSKSADHIKRHVEARALQMAAEEDAAAIRRSSPPIARRSTLRSPHFRTTSSSCCCAALRNRPIRRIAARDRWSRRFRTTSAR